MLRGHGRAIGVPERRHHHVLDGALFPVGEADFEFLARWERAGWRGRSGNYGTYGRDATDGGFWFDRLTIPLGIGEVVVGFHEIVDREVILPVEEARAAPDYLLELDHGVDRAHQDDVADVPGIDARRELLRRGEDGGD